MTVKLKTEVARNDNSKIEVVKIEFADSLYALIKPEILRLIDEIHKSSQNFPRPENNIARSDKTNLWSIPFDDVVYCDVKANIEHILDSNLRNIEKTLEIYNKHVYLLKETDKALAWS